jgi:hypothetical protein
MAIPFVALYLMVGLKTVTITGLMAVRSLELLIKGSLGRER